jgi:hypothetical protein
VGLSSGIATGEGDDKFDQTIGNFINTIKLVKLSIVTTTSIILPSHIHSSIMRSSPFPSLFFPLAWSKVQTQTLSTDIINRRNYRNHHLFIRFLQRILNLFVSLPSKIQVEQTYFLTARILARWELWSMFKDVKAQLSVKRDRQKL